MENLGDVATRVVMLTTQGLLETSMIILMILLCDWRIALVSLAGVAIFLVINTVMQNAGKQTKRLNAANEACVRANVVLGLDTMDIDGKELNPENHDIEVKNIEFSYDKRKIIDGISLTIPEKTTTAIVGPSGGGKTTLCNLIARFWDVDLGEITHEEVVEAAKKACCHDFISKLPDGYNTVIGEGGATLSGGEKQRISIARAIMKDSPIIILDEATANVDPENEKELTLAVDALTKEKTIIMIAHRLKTVRHADQIVVVDRGRIAQKGTHEELMKQDGIYRRFVDSRELAVSWKI